MGWETLLKLLHLEPKVEAKGEGNQLGLYVKNENNNNTYQITVVNLSDPETARAYVKELQKPEAEEKAKEMAYRKLKPLETVIDTLTPSTQEELTAKTVGLSALGELSFSGDLKTVVFVVGEQGKKEK
jgi:hypothetical protein